MTDQSRSPDLMDREDTPEDGQAPIREIEAVLSDQSQADCSCRSGDMSSYLRGDSGSRAVEHGSGGRG